MKVESCTQSVCNLALKFGEDGEDGDSGSGMSRPFGVALLIAGVDEKGPALFHTDPSGTFVRYDAKAIGAASEGAQQTLQDEYNQQMSLKEAETLALKILKQVMEYSINPTNVEIGSITVKDPVFRLYTKEQLENIIKDLKN
jgi:20S proteasome subunit alpha 5